MPHLLYNHLTYELANQTILTQAPFTAQVEVNGRGSPFALILPRFERFWVLIPIENEVEINGQRVEKIKLLRHGDTIRIGSERLCFHNHVNGHRLPCPRLNGPFSHVRGI